MNAWLLRVAMTAWLGIVASGLYILWDYETSPGKSSSSPALWPAETSIEQNRTGHTLVMLLHPQCACSRASVDELAIVMARTRGRLKSTLLFYSPASKQIDWTRGELWRRAKSVPGVVNLVDREGREAKIFRAINSGHTALYNSEGELLFSGGITPSRAHSGSNRGRSAIIAAVHGKRLNYHGSFVFGCDIFSPQSGVESL